MDSASRRPPTPILGVLGLVAVAMVVTCAKPSPSKRGRAAAYATVSGRLISLPALPMPNAEVRLEEDDNAGASRGNETPPPPGQDRVPVAVMKVGPTGAFRVEKVPPGRYLVRARVAGHAETRVRFETTGGETVVTVLRLPRAENFGGRVVDRHKRSVPAARVLLWPMVEPTDRPRETTADADGRFSFSGLGKGLHRLLVQAPGFAAAAMGPIDLPTADVVVSLEGDGQSIAGVVTAEGRPAGGAVVVVGGESLTPPREAVTSGDGTFSFGGLGPGVYELRAARGAMASKTSGEVVLGPAGDRPPPVHLALAAGWSIAGRVVDDRGKVLPDSDVRIDALSDDNLPEIQRTNREARWSSRALPPGEYRVIPRRPGFVTRGAIQIVLGPGKPAPQTMTLELVRGAQIVGRVVDQRGGGLPNATVRCLAPGRVDLMVIVDPLPLAAEAAALPAGASHALGRTRSVLTDSAGRFALPDILPGRFRLDVSRAGNVSARTDEILLAPGQRVDVGAVTLPDGVRVTGRVVDDADAPIEGAHVSARATGAAGGEAMLAMTDRGGQFSLALPPGGYNLAITAAGRVEQTVPVQAAAGASPRPVDVKLARADATLEGLVKDSGGRPVARAQVLAWPASTAGETTGAAAQRPPAGAATLSSTITDAGGHFTLQRLPRHPVLIEVKHADYPSATTVATSGTTTGITLPIPGRVLGAVHEKTTGGPINSYRIEAQGPEGRVASASRKGSGFSLARLVPGQWTVTVQAPGFATGQRTVDVPASTTLGEPSVRDFRIDLDRSK